MTADTSPPTFAITTSGTNINTNGTDAVFFKAAPSVHGYRQRPGHGDQLESFPACPAAGRGPRHEQRHLHGCGPPPQKGAIGVSATNNASPTTNLTVTITARRYGRRRSRSRSPPRHPALLGGPTDPSSTRAAQRLHSGSSTPVTDAVSGPASATFPAIGNWGRAHDHETVSSRRAARPSTAYSWAASPCGPTRAERTFTSKDILGNTTTRVFTFTAAPPLQRRRDLPGPGTPYGSGTWAGSITGTASDGGSGVGQVLVSVKDTTSGKCADATGAFTVNSCTTNFVDRSRTTSWSFAEAASNLTDGDSYTVTVKTIDNVGNTNASRPPPQHMDVRHERADAGKRRRGGWGSQNEAGEIDAGNKERHPHLHLLGSHGRRQRHYRNRQRRLHGRRRKKQHYRRHDHGARDRHGRPRQSHPG